MTAASNNSLNSLSLQALGTPQASPSKSPLPTGQDRLAVIDTYQAESLACGDALQANLGVINGDLMRMACRSE